MERRVIITKIDKEPDPKFSIYFIDFINEAARVIKERKEREEASKLFDLEKSPEIF
ncbi:MAG: hypothetical protein PHT02_11175 [Tissierellia bacterium]|nr:hypothetical protein [Tissierellia bacterium]